MNEYCVWYVVSSALYFVGTLIYFIAMPKVAQNDTNTSSPL